MTDYDELLADADKWITLLGSKVDDYETTSLVKKLAAALRAALAAQPDLRWLVGHLAHAHATPVPLPPRLVPLVSACRREYAPSRFTLEAVTGSATREEDT